MKGFSDYAMNRIKDFMTRLLRDFINFSPKTKEKGHNKKIINNYID